MARLGSMPLDKGYAWIVMLANFGAIVVCSGLLLSSGIVITTMQERFGANVAKTALMGSLYTALSSLAGPVGSLIISRTSCRLAVMTGAALMTTGYLITAFSTNLDLCIFSCGIISGSGNGICYAVLIIVNGFYFEKKLNFATGISMSGGGVGLFVLAPMLEISKEVYGYSGLFMMASAASLQLFVFASLMRPSVLENEVKYQRASIHKSEAKYQSIVPVYCKLLRDKAVLCLIFSFFFFSGGIYTAYMFWPSLCQSNGFSPLQASYFLSISGIAAVCGRVLIGVVTSNSLLNVFYIDCLSLIALGIPCLTFRFYASTSIGQLVNAGIIGCFSGAPLVVFAAVTIKCVGVKYLASTGGLQLLSGGIGSIVTPLLCGFIVTNGGKYEDAFATCGAFLLCSAVLVGITRFTEKPLAEETDGIPVDDEMICMNKDTV